MPSGKGTRAAKCQCGCGQAPAESCRMRKASCGCGASIIRLARSALATVNASCIACGGQLEPDCLFDRAAAGDRAAVNILESRQDARTARLGASPGRRAVQYRCGDCQAIRAAHGPCKRCGSERDATTSFMHPRAARVAGGDMPWGF